NGLHHRFDFGRVADVGLVGGCSRQRGRGFLRCGPIRAVVDRHLRAHACQRLADGAPNALATARDQGGLTFEIDHAVTGLSAKSMNSSSAFQVSTPGMCLAARLASTRPGPSSTTVLTFIARIETIVRAQSTWRSIWSRSSS